MYIVLSIPAVAIEFFFERSSRPVYSEDGTQLKKSGEDLEAKGLTEYMWDVLYWTWGCTAGAALLGDWVWYLYVSGVSGPPTEIRADQATDRSPSVLGICRIHRIHQCQVRLGPGRSSRGTGSRERRQGKRSKQASAEARKAGRAEDAVSIEVVRGSM